MVILGHCQVDQDHHGICKTQDGQFQAKKQRRGILLTKVFSTLTHIIIIMIGFTPRCLREELLTFELNDQHQQ
jgi:hypothetical protein